MEDENDVTNLNHLQILSVDAQNWNFCKDKSKHFQL